MRARPRASDCYVVAAMLVAASAGRLLDAAALLPGVHETAGVRGSTDGLLVSLVAAALLGRGVAIRWSRTRCLRALVLPVFLGQAGVFLAAEAAVRLANDRSPLDPDGLLGAALQATLAVVLLLALTVAYAVATSCAALQLGLLPLPSSAARRRGPVWPAARRPGVVVARGPPRAAGA